MQYEAETNPYCIWKDLYFTVPLDLVCTLQSCPVFASTVFVLSGKGQEKSKAVFPPSVSTAVNTLKCRWGCYQGSGAAKPLHFSNSWETTDKTFLGLKKLQHLLTHTL